MTTKQNANTREALVVNKEGATQGQQVDNEACETPHQTNCFGSRKLSLARLRWRMLSRTLHEGSSSLQSPPPSGSMRQFTSFGLVKLIDTSSRVAEAEEHCDDQKERLLQDTRDDGHQHISRGPNVSSTSTTTIGSKENNTAKNIASNGNNAANQWYRCTTVEEPNLDLEVRLLSEKLPLKELLRDPDNTGNVCVWPSEEILAYYCLKNKELCGSKVVCELGGGMTCLCGLVVSAACGANRVILTDGNSRCIDNVNEIVARNVNRFGQTLVEAKRLRWASEADYRDLSGQVDLVLCADCLYFDDGRRPLVATIHTILKETGVAVILAPRRGSTFEQFVGLCKERGFLVEQVLSYDTRVWELHEKYLRQKSDIYQPDLHYPQMIVLRKRATVNN